MTLPHKTEIDLKETADVRMNLKGLGWLVVTVAVCASAVVGFQFQMNYKIERLYTQNQVEHAALMTKITEFGQKQEMYALKAGVENAIVFVSRTRDEKLGVTNALVVDEIKFREDIRNFLK